MSVGVWMGSGRQRSVSIFKAPSRGFPRREKVHRYMSSCIKCYYRHFQFLSRISLKMRQWLKETQLPFPAKSSLQTFFLSGKWWVKFSLEVAKLAKPSVFEDGAITYWYLNLMKLNQSEMFICNPPWPIKNYCVRVIVNMSMAYSLYWIFKELVFWM